jgi:hypothetical protein
MTCAFLELCGRDSPSPRGLIAGDHGAASQAGRRALSLRERAARASDLVRIGSTAGVR